jgi:hypothetical protein
MSVTCQRNEPESAEDERIDDLASITANVKPAGRSVTKEATPASIHFGRTYGDSFAPGIRGDAHLKTLLDRTGSNSLSDYLKTTRQSPVAGNDREDRVNEEASTIRYASDQRFREAHRKTSTVHDGLFRRLAE